MSGQGTFLYIVRIGYPAEAAPGQKVTITVKVENRHTGIVGAMVTGKVESSVLSYNLAVDFGGVWDNLNPGQQKEFTGTFIMPGGNAKVTAYSQYWGDDNWWVDGEISCAVAVTGGDVTPVGDFVVKELKGTYR